MSENVKALMEQIKNTETSPAIFKVLIIATDCNCGFDAVIEFRSNARGASGISAHAETPEEALSILLDELIEKFGKCEYCQHFKNGLI